MYVMPPIKSKIKVQIKDYMILENVTLMITGLTGLVGESNHGKSSIYNAIKTLANNVSGNHYIRHGCTEVKVGVQFNDQVPLTILYKKSTSPSYVLNGIPYDKAGRSLPEDIAKVLNMSPIEYGDNKLNLNFCDQLEAPILKALTDTQLYNVTIKSFDGEKVNDAIKLAKKDMDELGVLIESDSIKHGVSKTRRLGLIEKLKAFDELSKLKPLYLDYERSFGLIDNLVYTKSKRDVLSGSIQEKNLMLMSLTQVEYASNLVKEARQYTIAVSKMEEIHRTREKLKPEYLEKRIKVLDGVNVVREAYSKVLKFVEDAKAVEKLQTQRDEIKRSQSRIAKLLALFEDAKDLQYIFGDAKTNADRKVYIVELTIHQGERKVLSNDLAVANIHLSRIEEDLIEAKRRFDNAICPQCNQPVKKPDKEMLDKLEEQIKALEKKKTEATSQKELLSKQLLELDEEIKKQGYDPEKLPEEIDSMRKKITAFESKAQPIIDKINKEIEAQEVK